MSEDNTETNPAPVEGEKTTTAAEEFITYDDFAKIKLKVAEIVEAGAHPNADRLLLLKLKVGASTRQICAGIKGHYDPATLVGKRLIIVANLQPRKLRGEVSEGMLLAASLDGDAGEEQLTLITTDNPDFPSGADVG